MHRENEECRAAWALCEKKKSKKKVQRDVVGGLCSASQDFCLCGKCKQNRLEYKVHTQGAAFNPISL